MRLCHNVDDYFGGVTEYDFNSIRILFPGVMQAHNMFVDGNRTSLVLEDYYFDYDEELYENTNLIQTFYITPFNKMVLRYKYSIIGGIY